MKVNVTLCFGCICATVVVALLSTGADAKPSYKLLENFDAEKKTKWWLVYRNLRLRPGYLDRCLRVTFSRPFKNNQLYIEIDHENSGAIDQAYFPIEFDSQGYNFKMEDGETVRVDVIDTDYSNYFIGFMTFAKRKDEIVFTYAVVPKPDGELLSKLSGRLNEITGIGIDALEPVDNENCQNLES